MFRTCWMHGIFCSLSLSLCYRPLVYHACPAIRIAHRHQSHCTLVNVMSVCILRIECKKKGRASITSHQICTIYIYIVCIQSHPSHRIDSFSAMVRHGSAHRCCDRKTAELQFLVIKFWRKAKRQTDNNNNNNNNQKTSVAFRNQAILKWQWLNGRAAWMQASAVIWEVTNILQYKYINGQYVCACTVSVFEWTDNNNILFILPSRWKFICLQDKAMKRFYWMFLYVRAYSCSCTLYDARGGHTTSTAVTGERNASGRDCILSAWCWLRWSRTHTHRMFPFFRCTQQIYVSRRTTALNEHELQSHIWRNGDTVIFFMCNAFADKCGPLERLPNKWYCCNVRSVIKFVQQ